MREDILKKCSYKKSNEALSKRHKELVHIQAGYEMKRRKSLVSVKCILSFQI